MKKKNYSPMILSTVLNVLFLGCGSGNTADSISRQNDRDSIIAQRKSQSNAGAVGTYEGDGRGAKIILTIEPSLISKDGSNIPAATLSGDLTFYPMLSVEKDNGSIHELFPFTDGLFDSVNKKLSFTIMREGNSYPCNCNMAADGSLNCHWRYREYLNFQVKKSSAEPHADIQKKDIPKKGFYSGENTDYKAELQLTAKVESEDSRLPRTVITGQFKMTAKVQDTTLDTPYSTRFSFYNGIYDPISGDLIAMAEGSGANIPVNCAIKNADELLCDWGLEIPPFDLKRNEK